MPLQEFRSIDPKTDQLIIDSATGEVVGIRTAQGKSVVVRQMGISTAVSRALLPSDVDNVLDCTAAATLTIPLDSLLLLSGKTNRATITAYQAGTGSIAFAAGASVTLYGTAPNISQYGTISIMHVGLNAWAYL